MNNDAAVSYFVKSLMNLMANKATRMLSDKQMSHQDMLKVVKVTNVSQPTCRPRFFFYFFFFLRS